MITKMTVTVLVNNFVSKSGLKGEHGLSLLLNIEENGIKNSILWDTGQTQETLLSNMEALNLKIDDVSTVVFSHGHYDHTGGLAGLLKLASRPIKVLASGYTWGNRFKNGAALKQIGSGLTREIILDLGGVVFEVNQPHHITDQLILTGPIERTEPCETNDVFVRSSGPSIVIDDFEDELALIVNTVSDGLFIITGCCHAGIINTIKYSRKITGIHNVKGVIGGLHLIDANIFRMETTRTFLRTLSCDVIAPLHCSGLSETCYLRRELGDSVKFPGVGETVQII